MKQLKLVSRVNPVIVLSIVLVFAAASSGNLQAQDSRLERAIAVMTENLSRAYAQNAEDLLKTAVAVGTVENNGDTARRLQMGQAARDVLVSVLSRSQVFTVVERGHLDDILREQKLQLSGITETENAVRVGELINARALITGSITEQADALVLSLRLINLETGQVVSESGAIEKTVFVKAAEKRLDMLYVSPMGIGLSLTGLSMTMAGNNATINPFAPMGETYFRRTAGVELRYRPFKFLMLGIGADWLYGQVWTSPSVSWDMGTLDYPAPTGAAPFTVNAEGIGIPLSVYGIWSPVRWLSLTAQVSAEYCVLDFEGLFDPSNGFGFGVNEFGPILQKEFFSVSILGGAEIFITPRLTFSVLAGYTYGVVTVEPDMWHIDLPDSIEISTSGFTLTPRITVYF